jgi:hypothetical protein
MVTWSFSYGVKEGEGSRETVFLIKARRSSHFCVGERLDTFLVFVMVLCTDENSGSFAVSRSQK